MTHQISVSWSTDDVKSVRPDLGDQEAAAVLDFILQKHDANEGINWGVIECAADILYGLAPKQGG